LGFGIGSALFDGVMLEGYAVIAEVGWARRAVFTSTMAVHISSTPETAT